MPEASHTHPLETATHYRGYAFVPQQVHLFVEHRVELQPSDFMALIRAINDRLREWYEGDPLKPVDGTQPITFAGKDAALSLVLVPADVPDDAKLLALVYRLNLIFRYDAEFKRRLESWNSESPGPDVLAVSGSAAPRIKLSASPNWELGGANSQIGTGGPANRPLPADGPDPNAWRAPIATVDVAILDTAHTQSERDEAYRKWSHLHPLVANLLGPYTPLRVTPMDDLYTAGDIGRPTNQHHLCPDEDYEMPDHGLFAAGIIHSIAPNATLHLIEVLNRNGVGTVDSVYRGLVHAVRSKKSTWLVINLSLVLDVDSEGENMWADLQEEIRHMSHEPGMAELSRYIPADEPGAEAAANTPKYGLKQFAEDVLRPLGVVCEQLKAQDTVVIAAAGNMGAAVDKNTNTVDCNPPAPVNRLPARYPAAYTDVIGVAALERGAAGALQPAPYSHRADLPPVEGFAAIGGGAGKNGVCGLYIGKFPDGQPNETGWAFWSGTSFAAPKVSGTVAALFNAGLQPSVFWRPRLQRFIQLYLQAASDVPPTVLGEEVIPE